jgi:hypothetical protein
VSLEISAFSGALGVASIVAAGYVVRTYLRELEADADPSIFPRGGLK